ncbi:MAG: hypothetical protein GXY83_34790 [Rhodopirellula sp.]|nr:hypothetical protein [Rhodopirellula sp.]
MDVSGVFDAISGIRTVVLGEAMLDVYLEGAAGRICQEAPVPAVAVARRNEFPGGAANVAANVAGLGSAAICLAVRGDDPEGALLEQALQSAGVSTEHLLWERGRRTLTKNRVVADGQILVRFDQGDVAAISSASQRALIDRLAEVFDRCDLIIVSDYGYGVLTPSVLAALAALQSQSPRFVVVDSKNLRRYRDVGVTAVKPNRAQAAQLLEQSGDGCPIEMATVLSWGAPLIAATGAEIVAVTLDCDGAVIFQRDCPPQRIAAQPVPNSRAIGAGDTFLAALGIALASGADARIAGQIAAAAARIVTRKDGTAACRHRELRDELLGRQTLGSEMVYVPNKPYHP